MNSGIKSLKRVGKTLGAYRTGLLNYLKHRITSGAVEGFINKIKTLKRQAYGFRDLEYIKLRPLSPTHAEVLVSRMNHFLYSEFKFCQLLSYKDDSPDPQGL